MGFENPAPLCCNLSPSSSPVLSGIVNAAYTFGLTDTANPSLPPDLINDLTATVSADYATLLPIADTLNTPSRWAPTSWWTSPWPATPLADWGI